MNKKKSNNETDELIKKVNIRAVNKLYRFTNSFSVLMLVVLFILSIYGPIRVNNLTREIKSLEKLKQAEVEKYQSLLSDNKVLEVKKKELEEELMTTYGFTIDSTMSLLKNEGLEKSLSANDAIKFILSRHKPNNNIIIAYYDRTIDEKRVGLELRALGYHFKNKSASEYMSKKKTNAIWFGAEVPIVDIKIVALTLIRAGIPIKGIRPYKNNSTYRNYKKNIIEVGASVDLDTKPQLTVEQVKNAKEFNK